MRTFWKGLTESRAPIIEAAEMRLKWRFFALCVVLLAVAGMAPKWLKSESPRAVVKPPPVDEMEETRRDAYTYLAEYAVTNPRMDVEVASYERLEVREPEENCLEAKLPFFGRWKNGPIEHFKLVARLHRVTEQQKYRIVSVGLIRTGIDGTELGPAESVRFF